MDYIPRYAQPFTLQEARQLAVPIITEGPLYVLEVHPHRGLHQIYLPRLNLRDLTSAKLPSAPSDDARRAEGSPIDIPRRRRFDTGIRGERDRYVRSNDRPEFNLPRVLAAVPKQRESACCKWSWPRREYRRAPTTAPLMDNPPVKRLRVVRVLELQKTPRNPLRPNIWTGLLQHRGRI